ncbi:universal stress protein [Halomicrobium sp. LC1Hm]|uniref:universal stress protein n=1 Tax=Halomicrobium sp. LC1Hm TaxID=2610902 RepID=UPI0012984C02|nr:universal stress protein [Halomicrobium sp. LC1Hm]QGA81290.1 Nucleotide-binding protein, UspA family [Halomicrobium sp. LC1Hm]
MTEYLVATSSVHVTAAAADYLQERLDPATDEVVVVAVREADSPDRDAGDAANVARSRLAAVAPTVETPDGDPTETLLDAIERRAPDVVLAGPNRGVEGAEGVGSTVRALLERAGCPVVVVPLPER